MKPGIKTIACCAWLGFVILLSIYCGDYFSKLLNSIKENVIRVEIPPEIDFAITIIPWNIFISLLLCVPLLFIKGKRASAAAKISDAIVFFFSLLAWNLIGVVHLWIFFPDSIGNYSGAPSLSAIEPYAINDGWSPFKFWCAWWGFIVLSNLFSIVIAFWIGLSRKANKSLLWS